MAKPSRHLRRSSVVMRLAVTSEWVARGRMLSVSRFIANEASHRLMSRRKVRPSAARSRWVGSAVAGGPNVQLMPAVSAGLSVTNCAVVILHLVRASIALLHFFSTTLDTIPLGDFLALVLTFAVNQHALGKIWTSTIGSMAAPRNLLTSRR
jgi:hypothetical protein